MAVAHAEDMCRDIARGRRRDQPRELGGREAVGRTQIGQSAHAVHLGFTRWQSRSTVQGRGLIHYPSVSHVILRLKYSTTTQTHELNAADPRRHRTDAVRLRTHGHCGWARVAAVVRETLKPPHEVHRAENLQHADVLLEVIAHLVDEC